ncbi:uncharacterized protein EAF02_002284 [Botrytis sinoallii]|uniref:uncharacterized protein n=1 Tax=Botrytis sinoallii TaxID=1463999 RepID=UPI00190065C9|nr:uncharacterized protein EAF02_002284 [Botrytis sinoallii]KAF7889869.1 hypothetical protein EAF02_002284 [Botrytis sinoallii]
MESAAPTERPALVKESVFNGIVWGGMVVSLLFVIGRIAIRLRSFGRLWLDDAFVVVGWICILVSTIIWHYEAHSMFLSAAIASGQMSPLDDPTYATDTEHYLRSSVAVIILFYTSLMTIKLSFMLFFRRLLSGVHEKALLIQWWSILAAILTSWLVCIGDIEYRCLVSDFIVIATKCVQSESIDFQRITLGVNCALDVITDILIITIPVAILWKVKITPRHRMALYGLFSLTVITMAFAIIRVAVVTAASRQPDSSWLYMWSAIEPPVAVVISCLVSFRALFGKKEPVSRVTGTYFGKRAGGYGTPFKKISNNGAQDSADYTMDTLVEDRHESTGPGTQLYCTTSRERMLHVTASDETHADPRK